MVTPGPNERLWHIYLACALSARLSSSRHQHFIILIQCVQSFSSEGGVPAHKILLGIFKLHLLHLLNEEMEILPGTTTESWSTAGSGWSFLRFAGGCRISRNFDVDVAGSLAVTAGGSSISCV